MNIFVISNDSFLAQEIITHFNSESHSIEIHENGLDVLNDIRDRIPDVVIIDNECDGINPLVLNKILCRDGRFDKTIFHFIAPKKIEDEDVGIIIKSPIVGTAYLAPAPGGKKFVDVGKKIKKGDSVLIV